MSHRPTFFMMTVVIVSVTGCGDRGAGSLTRQGLRQRQAVIETYLVFETPDGPENRIGKQTLEHGELTAKSA